MQRAGNNSSSSSKLTMDRNTRLVLGKVAIDLACLLAVSLTILGLFLYGEPYKRGFFCNDESLMHPYKESTVTSFTLYLTGLLLPILTMLLLEYHHSRSLPETKPLVLFGFTIPPWMPMAYAQIGMFGFGAALTVMTTDVAKYSVGRLRPHFMTLCQPTIDCSIPQNQHRYIQDFHCGAQNVSDRLLKELRLSFPSGHSSFSAYTMIYLALYLQLRITWSGSKLLRHFLQFLCIMMAWFTAMSRISNYKHHWSDVMAGSTIGTVIALIVAFGLADLFKERRLSKDARLHFGHHLQQQQHQNCTDDSKANNREYSEVAASSPELLHHHQGVNSSSFSTTTTTTMTGQQQVNNGTGGHIC